jgi:hypothetical protein
MGKYICKNYSFEGDNVENPCADAGGVLMKSNFENPVVCNDKTVEEQKSEGNCSSHGGEMGISPTKTDLEMQDFSWQNIKSMAIVVGVIALVAYIFKKK